MRGWVGRGKERGTQERKAAPILDCIAFFFWKMREGNFPFITSPCGALAAPPGLCNEGNGQPDPPCARSAKPARKALLLPCTRKSSPNQVPDVSNIKVQTSNSIQKFGEALSDILEAPLQPSRRRRSNRPSVRSKFVQTPTHCRTDIRSLLLWVKV